MQQPEETPTLNGMIHVDEYTRKDGVHVDEYWRSAPGCGEGSNNTNNPSPTGTIDDGGWGEPTDQTEKMKKQNEQMKEYLKILVSAIPNSNVRSTLQAAIESNGIYENLVKVDGEGQDAPNKSKDMKKILEEAVKLIPNNKIQNVLSAMNNLDFEMFDPNADNGGIVGETNDDYVFQDGGIVGDSTESIKKQQERMKEYAKILLQAVPNDKIRTALNAFVEADSFFNDITTTDGDEDGDGKVDLPEGFKNLDELFKEAVRLIPNNKIQNVLNAMNDIDFSMFDPDDDDGGIIDEMPENYLPQDGGIWGDSSEAIKKQSEKMQEYLGILLQAIPNEEIRSALQATVQAGNFLSNPEVIIDKDGQLHLPESLGGLLELAVKAIPSDKIRGVLEAMNNVINSDSENNKDNKNDDKQDKNKDKDDKNKEDKDKEEDNDPLKYLLTAAVTGEFDKNVLIGKAVDSFADNVLPDMPLDEQGKKTLEWFKKKNEQMQVLFDSVVDLMPEGSFMNDAAKTITQFKKTMDTQMEAMFDPEKMMEQKITEIKQWLVDFTDFTGQIIRGDFEYIKWDEIGEKLHISQIANMIDPIAGMVATLAVDVAPKVIKLVEGINAGDKAEIIKNALGAFTNCIGVIGQLKEVIGDKLAEMSKNVSAEVYNEAAKTYGDLEKIQDAGYRYEKFVKAEMMPEATTEALKLNDLSTEMMQGKATGFATNLDSIDVDAIANDNFEPTTVLQGGISKTDYPEINTEGLSKQSPQIDFGDSVIIASEIASSINAAMNAAANINSSGSNSPQSKAYVNKLNTSIDTLKQAQSGQKKDLDTLLQKLTTAKNQTEYSELLKKYTNQKQQYQKTQDLTSQLDYSAQNKDYQNVAQTAKNYMQQGSGTQQTVNQNLSREHYNNKLEELINNTLGIQPASAEEMPTGFANNAFNRKADFSEITKKNPLMQFNKYMNANNPDAKEWMDLGLGGPKNAPVSKEYTFISSKFNDNLNRDLILTGNKFIPKDYDGFIFNKDSSIAQNISNSKEFQNQVYAQFNDKTQKFKTDKLELNFTKDDNLKLSIGHGTLLHPQIDNKGYFTGLVYDKYNYEPKYYNYESSPKINLLNNSAFLIQSTGLLKKYYILIPVSFKWDKRI